MPTEARTFEAGLDKDSSPHILQPNAYRDALNIRNSGRGDGNVGVFSNLEGNTEVVVSLPSGGNKVVGAKDDPANQRTLYIVANTNGANRILEYNYKDDAVYTVIADASNSLQLSSDVLIASMDIVVSQSDDYLLFTDGVTEPKYINISAGKRTYDATLKVLKGEWGVDTSSVTEGDVVYKDITSGGNTKRYFYRATANTVTSAPYTSLSNPTPTQFWELCPRGLVYSQTTTEEFTTVVKPPLNTPLLQYGSEPKGYNNVKSSLWQMRYKYVKADGRESGYSPISNCPTPPEIADSVLNLELESQDINNVLNLAFEVPESLSYKSVKIEVRKNNSNGVALSDFKQVDEINLNDLKYTSSTDNIGSYQFDNNKYLIPTNPDIANQLFSNIPVKANAQAITSENRLVYGGITEGNPIDESLLRESTPEISDISTSNSPWDVGGTVEVFIRDTTTMAAPVNITTLTAETLLARKGTTFDNDKEVWVRFVGFDEGDLLTLKTGVVTDQTNPVGINSLYESFLEGVSKRDTGLVLDNSWRFTAQAVLTSSSESAICNQINDIFQGSNGYVTETWVGEFGNNWYGANALKTRVETLSGTTYLVLDPETTGTGGITPTIIARQLGADVTKGYGYNTGVVERTIKKGGSHQFGIVYSDSNGRISQVIDSPNLNLSLNNYWWKSSVSNAGAVFPEITLYNEPPDWATNWYLVKTRSNGSKNFVYLPTSKVVNMPDVGGSTNVFNNKWFINGYIDQTTYTTAPSLGGVAGAEFIYIPLNSLIGGYTSSYREIAQSEITYEYQKGDRIKFAYTYDSGATAPSVSGLCGTGSVNGDVDVEIIGYIPDYNCIYFRADDVPSSWTNAATAASNPFAGMFHSGNEAGSVNSNVGKLLFQLYTPEVENDNEFYYETGVGGTVSGTSHVYNGVTQTASGLTIPMVGFGDVYLKPRSYVTQFNFSDSGASGDYDAVLTTYFVEDENFYDKAPSASYSVGRPNRAFRKTTQEEDFVGNIGQIVRPNTMRWTEKFIPEAGFNGFGTVLDSSFKDVNGAFRDIMYLHSEGDRVIIFQKNRVGFVMTGRQILTQSDGTTQLLSNGTPLSDETYYAGDYGIDINPESFAFNGNRKYFTDVNTGTVLRLSLDGLTPISKKGMHSFFVEKLGELQKSGKRYYCIGDYDLKNDEYQLFLQKIDSQTYLEQDKTYIGGVLTMSVPSGAVVNLGDTLSVSWIASGVNGEFETTTQDCEVTQVSPTLQLTVPTGSGLKQLLDLYYDSTDVIIVNNFLFQEDAAVYSETLGAWTTRLSYAPEYISNVGNRFASFRGGKLFLHTNTANPGNFFGTDTESSINVISNQAPNLVKNWLTVGWKTDANYGDETEFSTPNQGVITSDQYYSKTGKYKYKEQQLFAPYLRAVSSGNNYVEGKKLRGYWNETKLVIQAGASRIYDVFSVSFKWIASNYTR